MYTIKRLPFVYLPFKVPICPVEEIITAIDKYNAIPEHALPSVLRPGHFIVETKNDMFDFFTTVRIIIIIVCIIQIRVDIIIITSILIK